MRRRSILYKHTVYVFLFIGIICTAASLLRTACFVNSWIRMENIEQQGEPVMHILSAIGSETSKFSGYATSIKLNGWMYRQHCMKRIKCCILWRDGTIHTINSPSLVDWEDSPKGPTIYAPQITCPFDDSLHHVVGVSVQLKCEVCPAKEDGLYVRPSIPESAVDKESFAVCLKIVYGHIDNVQFIDWLEYHRAMKVDKVFMFTYNVTQATHDVIRHYAKMGFVESRYFDYPLKSEFPDLEVKTEAMFAIHHPTVYDCYQRSKGYKYLAIFDMDEMLLPRRHGDIKELMKYLMEIHPDSAGFTLPSCIFDKNQQPDQSSPINATDARKYIRRSPCAMKHFRIKNIILPARTPAREFDSHTFTPSKPYERIYVKSSDATINHYRRCYDDLKDTNCLKSTMVEDRHILQFMDKIKTKIREPVELGNQLNEQDMDKI